MGLSGLPGSQTLLTEESDHPLRPVMDRRLGRPLPYQLANPTQAHPIVQGPKIPCFPPWGVCGINPSFPGLSPATG